MESIVLLNNQLLYTISKIEILEIIAKLNVTLILLHNLLETITMYVLTIMMDNTILSMLLHNLEIKYSFYLNVPYLVPDHKQ